MLGEATRDAIKQSICGLIDDHFTQIAEVYAAQDNKTNVKFSVNITDGKEGQTMSTTSISFVKTRITDKVIVYTDDEQMKIPGTE